MGFGEPQTVDEATRILWRTLIGNGEPGAIERIEKRQEALAEKFDNFLETREETCPFIKEREKNWQKVIRYAGFISLVLGVITGLLKIFEVF